MAIPFQLSVDENRVIRADFFPAKQTAKGLIVICHGFKGFKDWGMFPYVAEELSGEAHVVTFNFSHNGVGEDLENFTELEKFAKNTFTSEVEDLAFVLEHVTGRQNKHLLTSLPSNRLDELVNLPVILLGHSRGGAVSLIYALDHPEQINGVITWNGLIQIKGLFPDPLRQEMLEKGRAYTPNARTKQEMPLDREIIEDLEENWPRFDILTRIEHASFPLYMIQGSNDYERLLQGSSLLMQKNEQAKWVQIAGGNHTFNTVHPFQGTTGELSEALQETKKALEAMW